MDISLIPFTFLIFSVICLLLIFIYSRLTGVVPMPSSVKERDIIVSILSEYEEVRNITDLGSGWGGLVRHMSLRLRDRKIEAVERSPLPWVFSRIFASFAQYRNISHKRMDFFSLELEDGRAYVCYLSGPAMKRLRKKFERDLPQNGMLISLAFAMPGWTPVRVEYADSLFPSPVYVYEY